MKRKLKAEKGQAAGTDAWILVGLIGLMMIFYIMFLPPAERERLLSDSSSTIGSSAPIVTGTILKINPGRIEAMAAAGFEHVIPTFKVVELKNAQVLASFNPFTVKNNWLSNDVFKTSFHLDNPDLIDAPILVFEAPTRAGVLTIRLNSQIIYNFEPSGADVPPIMVRKQDLKEDNTLEVEAQGVGWRFWRTNRYDLVNTRLIGDVSDISKQKAQNIFTIAPSEKEGLQTSMLSFVPECDQQKVGTMDIVLNGNSIYSAIPTCNSPFQTEIGIASLHEGINELVFKTSKGTILVNRAKVQTKLKQTGSFIQYFELNQSVFNEIIAGRRQVELQIDFVDDGQPKRSTLNVNGHMAFIDQRQPFYARPLNQWVLPGPRNYLELRPETALNVPELRIAVR